MMNLLYDYTFKAMDRWTKLCEKLDTYWIYIIDFQQRSLKFSQQQPPVEAPLSPVASLSAVYGREEPQPSKMP